MMAKYFALCASLPMLKFDEAPVLSSDTFLSYCSSYLKKDRMEEIQRLSIAPSASDEFEKHTLAFHYVNWEMSMRNSIVKIRAQKLSADSRAYEKMDVSFETDAATAVVHAYNAPNPLEREKQLDLARWRKIEELEAGHLFDFDLLCGYRLKLQILEKWTRRSAAKAAENLDHLTERVQMKETAGTEQ